MTTNLSTKQIAAYPTSIFLAVAVCLWANALALRHSQNLCPRANHIFSSKQIARPKSGDATPVHIHQQPLRYHVSKPFLSSGSTLV